MEIRPRPARCGIAPVDSRTIGRVLLYEELELVGVVRVNWLQIGCPFCPSEVNLPAAMADTEVTCDGCAKTYLVPTPAAPVLAAAGPLVPLAILRVPGLAGNTARGIAPIPHLPEPAIGDPAGRSTPLPPNLRRSGGLAAGGSTAGGSAGAGGRFPWEMSAEVRASAAAIFGADSQPGEDENELEAVQRRLRKERIRAAVRWTTMTVGMLALIAVAAYFLQR